MYENLMEEVVSPENYGRAWKAVVANKGAPGIDGMTIKELSEHLERHWPKIRTIPTKPSHPNDIRINHARNFFECMKTRKQPVLHAELAYQTMTAIKLSADSYRQRRMLAWDPKTERLAKEAPPRVSL